MHLVPVLGTVYAHCTSLVYYAHTHLHYTLMKEVKMVACFQRTNCHFIRDVWAKELGKNLFSLAKKKGNS